MDNSGAGQQFARPRELHGPRPAPLTVRKESRKIRKPPVAPPPQQQQQYRQPVIIYAVSPKVIHTTPADFMSVVQSLTGVHAAAAASSSSSHSGGATAGNPLGNKGFMVPFSPAARLAAFEKTATSSSSPSASASARILNREVVVDDDVMVEIIQSPEERRAGGGGILSPGPASLPWISPGMFTPTALFTPPPSIHLAASPDANNLIFSSTAMVPSPAAAYWDLFNHYQH